MNYIIVHKLPLTIFDELTIPIPYSFPIEGKINAIEWMMSRGLQSICKVIPANLFTSLGGKI